MFLVELYLAAKTEKQYGISYKNFIAKHSINLTVRITQNF